MTEEKLRIQHELLAEIKDSIKLLEKNPYAQNQKILVGLRIRRDKLSSTIPESIALLKETYEKEVKSILSSIKVSSNRALLAGLYSRRATLRAKIAVLNQDESNFI